MAASALLGTAVLAASIDLPRDALWVVVRGCAFMQHQVGQPFPCRGVEGGPAGFAILRVPGHATHFLVTPTQPVTGLEAPPAQARLAVGAWRAALAFRAEVAAGTGLGPGDMALSINPRRARGQDQLHIHMGCLNPDWAVPIRAEARHIGTAWARLPEPVDGVAMWARRVRQAAVRDADPFTSLMALPASRIDRTNVVFAAFGLSRDGRDLVQVATQTAGTSAEDALDNRCGDPR